MTDVFADPSDVYRIGSSRLRDRRRIASWPGAVHELDAGGLLHQFADFFGGNLRSSLDMNGFRMPKKCRNTNRGRVYRNVFVAENLASLPDYGRCLC